MRKRIEVTSEEAARLYSQSRSGHRPGKRATRDGIAYEVNARGMWIRRTMKPHELKDAVGCRMNNGARRRMRG